VFVFTRHAVAARLRTLSAPLPEEHPATGTAGL